MSMRKNEFDSKFHMNTAGEYNFYGNLDKKICVTADYLYKCQYTFQRLSKIKIKTTTERIQI